MKLYYSAGACSLSPHIVMAELALDYSCIRVDLKTKKTETGEDYLAVNPKGQVPTLVLDSGEKLTEGPAIVQYLADLKPEKKLAPPNGTMERVRLQELLNMISTEIHKGFTPLFAAGRMIANPEGQAQLKEYSQNNLFQKFDLLAADLKKKPFLMGEQFSVADAYLYTCLSWHKYVQMDLGKWPELKSYIDRIHNRPSTQKARQEEKIK